MNLLNYWGKITVLFEPGYKNIKRCIPSVSDTGNYEFSKVTNKRHSSFAKNIEIWQISCGICRFQWLLSEKCQPVYKNIQGKLEQIYPINCLYVWLFRYLHKIHMYLNHQNKLVNLSCPRMQKLVLLLSNILVFDENLDNIFLLRNIINYK